MGDMAWAVGPWALNFWVGLAALYPLIRIFRRAGLEPRPAVFVFVPIVGFALLGFSHAQAAGAVNSSFRSYFRYTGALVTSDLGWLLGAGFAPLVALSLAVYLGVGYVGLYLLSGAVGTLGALWISRAGGLPND